MGSANFESGLRPDLLHSKMFSSKTKHHWVSISMELHLIFNYKSFEKIWISNEVLNVSWEGIQWLDGSCVQDLMQIVCGLPQRAISFSYRTFNEDSHTFVNKLEILHQNLISVEFQEIGFLAISIRLILTIFGLFFFSTHQGTEDLQKSQTPFCHSIFNSKSIFSVLWFETWTTSKMDWLPAKKAASKMLKGARYVRNTMTDLQLGRKKWK